MFFRFLLAGGSGFAIDAGITYLLVWLGVAPWLARMPAILIAMTYTWLANRHFTYKVKKKRSADEAVRYAFAAAAMALLNYLIFVLLVRHGTQPVVAVTLATACQTVLSFQIYRRLVFRDS